MRSRLDQLRQQFSFFSSLERLPAIVRIVMVTAVLCCSGCRESASTAIPRLVKQLESQSPSERNAACQELAIYGPDAEPATKALIKRLADPNLGIRSSAAYALRKIDTAEATEALDSYKK